MQILALTVRNVTHYTLESVKRERRKELLQTIRMLHDKNNSILCIDVLLNFISSECPSASLREIYGKLREGLYFFGCINGSRADGSQFG